MIPLLFTVHAHQPVGNFGWVFERAFENCYQPFLEMLGRYPSFKATLHYSGCLLDWIEQNRPAHVKLLKKLIKEGQVELLGGGYYEPILPAIPERDAMAQIESYSDHLEKVFGRRPVGLWLAERVWDPALPKLLAACGIKYTLVDDSHFRFGGLAAEEVWGPFFTEREGHRLIIFPIDKNLRYLIPFREPNHTVGYLRQRAKEAPGFIACYGDDTEKFGVWPGTREWVYERGWLKRFLETLAEEEIRTVHFSELLETARPRGRVYLPPASYEEMMEWVLPAGLGERFEDFVDEIKSTNRWAALSPFIRGGHWDMFLSKYEESNRMHKRMLLASARLAKKRAVPPAARAALHRSQCNCAYWHGVFGGLYLPHLRHAVYEQAMEAEELAGVNRGLRIENLDFNCDGTAEVLIFSPELNLILDAARGGAIILLEYPEKRFSLSNIMGRRRETYHRKLSRAAAEQQGQVSTIHERVVAKEPHLERLLIHDRFPRNSLQDHILPPEIALEDLEKENAPFLGRFAGEPYQILAQTADQVVLARVDRAGELPLRLEKTLLFKKGRAGFSAQYRLTAGRGQPARFRLAVEFNLTLLSGDDPLRYFRLNGQEPPDRLPAGRGRHEKISRLELINEADGFSAALQAEPPADLFRFPVFTVSQSESGFEKTFQGSALWFTWLVELGPEEEAGRRLEFDLFSL